MNCRAKYRNKNFNEKDINKLIRLHIEVEQKLRATKGFRDNGKLFVAFKNDINRSTAALGKVNAEYTAKVATITGNRTVFIDVSNHFLNLDAYNRTLIESIPVEGLVMDKDGNIMYQKSPAMEKPIKELDDKLKLFLQSIGVNYSSLEAITDSNGNPLDVVARASMLNKLVEVVEGRADVSTLPEEASHFFVEMLGESDPGLRWMMDNITNYQLYRDVVEEYYDLYEGDINKLKKEAIGKMIAQKIVGKFKENNAENNTWFKALWNKIKAIFKGSNFQPEIDAFELSAKRILENTTEGLKKINSKEDYYQVSNKGKTADEVNAKLDEFTRTVNSPTYTTEEDNRYFRFVEGIKRFIKNRVTDKQTKVFESKVGKQAAKDINSDPNNIVKRNTGIKLHDVARNLVDLFASGQGNIKQVDKSILTDAQFAELAVGVRDVVNQINDIQSSIDPDKKATIRTEQIIYSEKADMAGSMDVTVVFSDGSIGIFDWKFINFKTADGKVIDTGLNPAKEESYNLQISEYKRILMSEVGVGKIRISRVVPINVQYKAEKKGNSYMLLPELKSLEIGSKDYLDQVPLADELTNDDRLNELLTVLLGVKKELGDKLKKKKNDVRLQAQLYNITKAIKDIQLNHDVNSVLDAAGLMFNDIERRIGINDAEDPNYLTEGEITDYLKSINIYKNISANAENVLNNLKDDEEKTKLRNRLDSSSGALNRLEHSLNEKVKERIHEYAAKEGVKNIDSLQKETSLVGNAFRTLASWNHPIFKLLNKFIKKAIDDTRSVVNTKATELEGITDRLYKWFGSKDIKVFDYLIDNETGNLIAEYKKELFKDKETAISASNLTWLKENFVQNTEDKARFEKNKTEYFEKLDKFFKNKTEAEIAKMKEQWLNKYDVSRDTAWLNRNNYYLSVKDKSKWQSDAFKYVQNNQPLKDFYDYYTKQMREINSFVPMDISKNFIPNIHKDYVDKVLANGMSSITGLGESLLTSLEVREHDATFGMIDAKTGEPIPSIPVLYTNKIDANLKSRDLATSLLLFIKTTYNHKHMSEIEDSVLLLREQLTRQKQVVTDRLGRPILKEIGDGFETAIGNKHTLEAFNTYVNGYLYGQMIQNKDKTFEAFGRQLSGTKALKQAMSWLSTKALAFNPISIGANLTGGMANTYLMGMKGTAYSRKQLASAHNNFISQHSKFKAFAAFFEVSQEDLTMEKARQLSASKLGKVLSHETMFIGQRKTDEFIDETVTAAMGENYGLSLDGKITKLSKLPEGSKSLWELAEIKDGKLVVQGLTEEALNNFRRKVRVTTGAIKGSTSKEDFSIIQTNILGQMVMQFRNWMPAMVKERFGDLRYNEDMEEYEMGRFKAGFSEIVHKGFIPALGKFAAEIGSFSLYKYKADETRARIEYAEHLLKNPDLELTFEEYIEVKEAQLRALAAEVRMYLIVLGAIMALAGDWDDDDKPDYKKYWATRKLVKLMHRSALELSFFFDPNSVTEIIKTPIPLVGLIIDAQSLVGNTVDETLDLLFDRSDSKDRAGKLHYTARMIPIVSTGTNFFEVFENSLK